MLREHDPDLCLATRITSNHEHITKALKWEEMESKERFCEIHTTVGITYENPQCMLRAINSVGSPISNYAEVGLDRLQRLFEPQ
uniref:Uncharacterized protein n=1 Tax=Romanomermis culicivorax TaxID=13658 RepID=A0A915HR90_ROMCU